MFKISICLLGHIKIYIFKGYYGRNSMLINQLLLPFVIQYYCIVVEASDISSELKAIYQIDCYSDVLFPDLIQKHILKIYIYLVHPIPLQNKISKYQVYVYLYYYIIISYLFYIKGIFPAIYLIIFSTMISFLKKLSTSTQFTLLSPLNQVSCLFA